MIVINLLNEIGPEQLKPGETLCPIFSRFEPVEGGFSGSHVTVKSMAFLCIGDKCGMWFRCSNQPANPTAVRK